MYFISRLFFIYSIICSTVFVSEIQSFKQDLINLKVSGEVILVLLNFKRPSDISLPAQILYHSRKIVSKNIFVDIYT